MVYQAYGGTNNTNSMSGDQNRKIFLGGLSYRYVLLFIYSKKYSLVFFCSTTDDTLRSFCSRYGKITDCLVMKNQEGNSRGFGFVTYEGRFEFIQN
jgi:RNA recognition motif-containing protein